LKSTGFGVIGSMLEETIMAPNQTKEIADTLEQLCGVIDELSNRLRLYDATFRFVKANYPTEADILDGCLAMTASRPIVQNAASHEYAALVQKAHVLVSGVLQEIKNPDATAA
jgi:hypothetical protein